MGLEDKLRQHINIVVEDACYEIIDEPTSMPESIYVIYTDRSGPTKWTSSRAEAMYLSIKVLNISLLNLYDKRRRSNN